MNLDYVNTNVGGIGHLLKAMHTTVYRLNGNVLPSLSDGNRIG